jgi:hypothetical protein
VDTIVENSKKKFLNDGEDAEWNFEIHENATELEGFGTSPVVDDGLEGLPACGGEGDQQGNDGADGKDPSVTFTPVPEQQ